jgi:hypothetical protein
MGGQASAFNHAITECRGDIIVFLDADDWWAPNKLSRVVDVMSANPYVGVLGHGIVESARDGSERRGAPDIAERFTLNSLAAARLFRLRKSYLGTSRMAFRADLLRRIGSIPTSLTIEADEYLFTLGAALSEVIILPDTLRYYRLHGTNLYNSAGDRIASLRLKQAVITALAAVLKNELPRRGVPADASDCVVEIIRAEADQLRLMLDGGTPWETVRTEKTIYKVLHGDSSRSHRLFRWATMLPAYVLPPRWFYVARSWLTMQGWYRTAREKVLPVPPITRVAAPEDFKG